MAFSGLISAHTLINSHISYFEIQRIHAKANSYRGSSNIGLSLVVRNTDIEGATIARPNPNPAEPFSVPAVCHSLRDGILLAIQGYENTCPNVYQARSNRNVTNHCNHKHLQPILSRFLTRPL